MDNLIAMTITNLFIEIIMLVILLIKYKRTLDILFKFLYPMLGVIIGTQIAMLINLVRLV